MGLLSALHKNLEIICEFIFPSAAPWREGRKIEGACCQRCGSPFEIPVSIPIQECANCKGIPWHLDRAFSCYLFEGDPRRSILEFKYHRNFYWRAVLGKVLVEGYRDGFAEVAFDALVPVPLHAAKRRDRGFNQAEELAFVLSSSVQKPVWNCLSRPHETISQAIQNRENRLKSPLGSFQMMRRFDVRGRSLLIIDDVLTTGTTANECARVLREAGARYIAVLTVARGVGS